MNTLRSHWQFITMTALLLVIITLQGSQAITSRTEPAAAPTTSLINAGLVQPFVSRWNFKVKDVDAYNTLAWAAAGSPRKVFGGIYTVEGVGLSKTSVENALGGNYEWVEPDYVMYLDPPTYLEYDDGLEWLVTPNDPMLGEQWSVNRTQQPSAWSVTTGEGVVVAVVDTGVQCYHPDLRCTADGYDFVDNDALPNDEQGHGTHVSGIVAAWGNNAQGVAGVAYNARIMPVRVLGVSGSGQYSAIAAGIAYAAEHGAHVINLSLGGPTPANTLQEAIDYAWTRGAVVVCAAGNASSSVPNYPAAYENCLSVAATTPNDGRASFSSYGTTVDIGAPGTGILSTVRGNAYQAWNGTSMAAPNVAGTAALVKAAHMEWGNTQIRQAILSTADNINVAGIGSGRVNAARSVGASAPNPQPTQPAVPVPTVPSAPGDFAAQIFELINTARVQNGLRRFRYDSRLQDAADFHNRWMRDTGCFSHNCPGEPEVWQRMRNANYPVNGGGENIGKGYVNPQAMMDGWMNSPGHRAAILNTYWPDLGCGYLRGPSGQPYDSYWSCEFASGAVAPPGTATPPVQPTARATFLPPTPTLFNPRPTTTTPVRPQVSVTPVRTVIVVPKPTETSVPAATPPVTGRRVAYVFRAADSKALDIQGQLCGILRNCEWNLLTLTTKVTVPAGSGEQLDKLMDRLCVKPYYRGVTCEP